MPQFTFSQVIHEVAQPAAPAPPPLSVPTIATAPVLTTVPTGSPVIYTLATGIAGKPTPTLTHDLWKNGSLFVSSYVSGAYTAPSDGDTYQIRATATNSQGSATSNSAIITSATVGALVPAFTYQTAGDIAIGPSYYYNFQASNSPTGYRVASGSIPLLMSINSTGILSSTRGAVPPPGTYNFTVSATNANGTGQSNPQTVVVDYLPMVIGGPVAGVPHRFVVPGYYDPVNGYNGTFTSIQWYNNLADGNGPVLLSGATNLTYTPQSTDVFLSVRLGFNSKTYSSGEFTTPNKIAVASAVQQTSATLLSQRGSGGYGSISKGATFNALTYARYTSGTGHYTENIMAPGTYPAGSTTAFGSVTNLSSFGGVSGIVGMYTLSPVKVAVPVTDPAPATATRPAASTGTGFFVTNGALYDYNGNKFRIRGMNQCHFDSSSVGQFKAGANTIRVFTNLREGWSTPTISGQALRPLMASYITNKTIPIPTCNYYYISFSGTVAGNILTIAADADVTSGGYISLTGNQAVTVSPTTAIPTLLTPLIHQYGSGTIGKAGTYILRHSSYSSATTMFTGTSSAVGTACKFTATIVGTTGVMTVSALDAANTQGISVGDYIWIGGKTSAQVVSFGTGTGGTGTYNIQINLSIPTKTAFTPSQFYTSGDSSPALPVAIARQWVEQFATRWTEFEPYQIINIANEWGPNSTGPSDTVWRDACIAAVQVMRDGGYKGPIMLDAPGSGQDGGTAYTILQFAGDIYDADPQKNVIVSLHLYGSWPPGSFAPIARQMNAVTAARGVPFCVGEFGPDNLLTGNGSRTLLDPREVMAHCEAYNIHWLAWAWDDTASDSDTIASTVLATGTAGSAGTTTVFNGNYNPVTGLMTVTKLTSGLISIGDYIWSGAICWAQVTSFGTSTGGVGTMFCTTVGNESGLADYNFAMCKLAGGFNTGGGGYATGSSADLTRFGKTVVLDPGVGLQAIATKASMF